MRICAHCSKLQYIKGYHTIIYRTLFGKMHIRSPQIIECSCETHETLSSSPLTKLLTDRVSPELLYLESRWASLMSYGVTASLLEEVFPIQILPAKTGESLILSQSRATERRSGRTCQ